MARLPNAVTTLASRGVAIVGHGVGFCHWVLFEISGAEDRNSGNFVAVVETHDDDAARLRAVAIDAFDVGAHDLATLADEQQLLVVLVDQLHGRNATGLVALDGDERHALATA